ncbi:MAG TPA: glycosyltransferase family 4 protein [Firmicutes bacterium]|jgi:1,2-diacylglycerol 3-alpha-glucosyltransferase|nr:MAG: hypothetical protein AA931_06915 [Peptococcaceae bacterium 1109]HHT72384.1 glycosyltransferase family 4 protein [Bacillota bacterium]
MKIAFFTDSYAPYVSGVVRSLQRFTKGLVQEGHEVYIFAPFYYGKKFRGEIAQQSDPYATKVFRFYSVPAPTCPDYFLPIPISIRAFKVLRELDVDIIHTHAPFLSGQLGANLARKLGVPLFFTHHTVYQEYVHYVPAPQKATKAVVINFLKWYCRQCDHIIAPTEMTREMILDLYKLPTPVTTLPTGVDLDPYDDADPTWLRASLGIPQEQPVILSLGRLSKEKSPGMLLQAFSIIRERLPEAVFVFAGGGPIREALEQDAQRMGLGSHTYFTGPLDADQVAAAYMGADLFMFASQTETQGLVSLEAMAGGLPIVAVDASGTNAVVVHGKTGFLTPPDPEALAEKALQVLQSPELMAEFSAQARKQAEQYSVTATASRLVKLYESVLNQS